MGHFGSTKFVSTFASSYLKTNVWTGGGLTVGPTIEASFLCFVF